ncbi:substrate-binding domain-containing protein [Sphingomonas sp.]|uniref:substrate-binding domain-containing protein n=1 Tax=Sphingomonas sp. TaxID=28214 RepID=UPI0025E17925|nr:substrate-binding domain-containing protein [Sphingomonas sp.]
MSKLPLIFPAILLLTACGGGSSGGGGGSTGQIKVVGSSTVYPFTTAVAEAFQRDNPGTTVIVESTGTGAGMKLFCAGIGGDTPDVANASRQIKKSEYDTCVKNGAKSIIEVPIGIDGLTFIEDKGATPLNLTVKDIYGALAANPYGKPNTAKTWHDVNPALPERKIRVMGPPPTSGTRDSLADLILAKGCETDPAMKALKASDEKRQKDICTKVREDGVYIEAGENDNLLVQKVSVDKDTIGVLGFSYLDENADKVKAVSLAGVAPTEETISNLTYPGSRKLYIYIKGEHLAVKPKLKGFVAAYSKLWGKGGQLEKRGLVPFGGADASSAVAQATALTPLDGSTLK